MQTDALVALPGAPQSVAERVIKLLGLYRLVAVAGLLALIVTQSGWLAGRFVFVVFLVFYAILHAVVANHYDVILRSPRMWLGALFATDIILGILAADLGGSFLFVTGLLPILFVHGWLLRQRHAFLHAAVLAIVVLFANQSDAHALTQAAFIGAGGFVAATLGVLLGRAGHEVAVLADQRGVDLEKLSALNQRIIDDLDQGVLVLDPAGQLVQINPQAARWLLGRGDAAPRLPMPLEDVSQSLATRWSAWKNGAPQAEAATVKIGSTDHPITVRLRFVSVDMERSNETILFLEDLALAQKQAQQIKLAALGRLTANIAHEIRNPLSAIRQASQLLAESGNETGEGNHALTEMVEKNVRRIDRIVSNVLSLSKRDKVAHDSISLQQVLPEMVREWCVQQGVAPTTVSVQVVGNLVVTADRGHLEEIVWNLLGNGYRHSKKGDACVTVSARAGYSGQLVAIQITDNGNGVPADDRENIFEPFFSKSGSSGLGLFISRELAESNGGTLDLTGHSPGAQFRLMLPGKELGE